MRDVCKNKACSVTGGHQQNCTTILQQHWNMYNKQGNSVEMFNIVNVVN